MLFTHVEAEVILARPCLCAFPTEPPGLWPQCPLASDIGRVSPNTHSGSVKCSKHPRNSMCSTSRICINWFKHPLILRSTYSSCRLLRTTQMWSWTPRTNALALRTSFGHGTPMLPDYLLYVHICRFFSYVYCITVLYYTTLYILYSIICIYIIYNYDCYYFTFYAHLQAAWNDSSRRKSFRCQGSVPCSCQMTHAERDFPRASDRWGKGNFMYGAKCSSEQLKAWQHGNFHGVNWVTRGQFNLGRFS
jgi:hypothetical protein